MCHNFFYFFSHIAHFLSFPFREDSLSLTVDEEGLFPEAESSEQEAETFEQEAEQEAETSEQEPEQEDEQEDLVCVGSYKPPTPHYNPDAPPYSPSDESPETDGDESELDIEIEMYVY